MDDDMKRRLLAMEPTPGIENMTREEAVAHFDARTKELRDRINSLPPAEMLRLAADFLDMEEIRPGSTPTGWARAIAERALAKLSS